MTSCRVLWKAAQHGVALVLLVQFDDKIRMGNLEEKFWSLA